MSEIIKYKKQPFEIAVYNTEKRFLEICGDPKIFTREAGFALQQIKGNGSLQQIAKNPVGQDTIETAVLNVALTGLSLNPVYAYAYLIPRKGKCCLDISYKGLIKIATEENTNISSISAMVVYTWDQFEYHEGSKPYVKHIPNMAPDVNDMDQILKSPALIWDYVVGAYSRAIMRDGTADVVVMPKWRIWKIFQTSKSKDDKYSPWQNWPEEQIRKTVIKYHSKTLQGTGMSRLQNAVAILNEHEGLNKNVSPEPSNADELNRRLEGNADTGGDNSTVDAEFTGGEEHGNGFEHQEETTSKGEVSLEATLAKSIEATKTLSALQTVWEMLLQKKDQLSQEAINNLTDLKNERKDILNERKDILQADANSEKTKGSTDKSDDKCRSCIRVDGCMNKTLKTGMENCKGPYPV